MEKALAKFHENMQGVELLCYGIMEKANNQLTINLKDRKKPSLGFLIESYIVQSIIQKQCLRIANYQVTLFTKNNTTSWTKCKFVSFCGKKVHSFPNGSNYTRNTTGKICDINLHKTFMGQFLYNSSAYLLSHAYLV